MSLRVTCNSCGKVYEADEGMLGKRVKCRQCGVLFVVTLPVAENEEGDGGEKEGYDVAGIAELSAAGVSAEEAAFRNKQKRKNVPFDFPLSDVADLVLLMGALLGFVGWIVNVTRQMDVGGEWWINYVRSGVAAGLFALVGGGLISAAMEKAGEKGRFEMPEALRGRAVASYALSFAMCYAMWLSTGKASSLLVGGVGGLVIAPGLLFFFFRLRPKEFPLAFAMTAGAYVVSVALIVGMVVGVNVAAVKILDNSRSNLGMGHNPLAAHLVWAAGPKEEVVAVAVATTQVAAPGKVEKRVEAPVAAVKAVLPAWVAEAEVVKGLEGFASLVYPRSGGPWVVAVRAAEQNQEQLELWNAGTGVSDWKVRYGRKQESFIVNPSGQFLVYVANFPSLSATVWQPKGGKAQAVGLNSQYGTPELVGFRNDEVFVVYWRQGQGARVELCNAMTGMRERQFMAVACEKSPTCFAISPDGTMLAMARRANEMAGVQLYSLTSGSPMALLAIEQFDKSWPVKPMGMSFSPDGQKLAVIFEQGGTQVLLCWNTQSGVMLGQHAYPPGQLRYGDVRQSVGSALDWVGGGSAWLVSGNALIDSASGASVADLNMPDAVGHVVVDQETVGVIRPVQGGMAVTKVKLDLGKAPGLSPAAQ